jgi:hypothetical protein
MAGDRKGKTGATTDPGNPLETSSRDTSVPATVTGQGAPPRGRTAREPRSRRSCQLGRSARPDRTPHRPPIDSERNDV